MKKLRHLWIELYGINIYYIRCPRSDYEKRIKAEFGHNAPKAGPDVDGRFEVHDKDGEKIGVIWLDEDADMGHLVHECLHAAHYFLQDRGLHLSDSAEEAYAYLIQYIFKKTKGMLK